MHSNVRGLKSKLQSLNHTVNNVLLPSCISLNEHGVRGNSQINIENYFTFSKNRSNKRMGGVSLSIPNENRQSFMKICEGEDTDEYLIIRNDEYKPPLNIVSMYGECESRYSNDDILERWQRFLRELREIEERGENLIIASDMNRKVGNDDLGIKGNSEEVSHGGLLVRELIASGNYFFANNTDLVEGGPITRIDPSNNSKGSVLDVFILSKALQKHLDKMVIDENYKYPMQYAIKEDGNVKLKRSHHLTIVLYLKDLPTSKSPNKEERVEPKWNYNKVGAWDKYEIVTKLPFSMPCSAC